MRVTVRLRGISGLPAKRPLGVSVGAPLPSAILRFEAEDCPAIELPEIQENQGASSPTGPNGHDPKAAHAALPVVLNTTPCRRTSSSEAADSIPMRRTRKIGRARPGQKTYFNRDSTSLANKKNHEKTRPGNG